MSSYKDPQFAIRSTICKKIEWSHKVDEYGVPHVNVMVGVDLDEILKMIGNSLFFESMLSVLSCFLCKLLKLMKITLMLWGYENIFLSWKNVLNLIESS